jgi:hypothetical protein
MNFRIYRTYEWVLPKRQLSEIRFGGPPPTKVLKTTETLQYLDGMSEEWKDVPVVEAPKPPYPVETDRFGGL